MVSSVCKPQHEHESISVCSPTTTNNAAFDVNSRHNSGLKSGLVDSLLLQYPRTMDAADLAKEVVAFAKLRDRPATVALIVKSNALNAILKVIAPIENGRRLLRVVQPDVTATVDYDCNHLGRIVSILESLCFRGATLHLYSIMENGDLSDKSITYWMFSRMDKDDRQVSRQKMQDALECLFTID